MQATTRLPTSRAGCLNKERRVCKDISLALKLSSEIFSIRIGKNSLIALLMICGETSVPQIGGANAVDKILRP